MPGYNEVSRMIRRTLLAAALAAAMTLEASGQGLRQVGNDDFGMTIEEIHPTGSGLRVRVLIENLTTGKEVFLHHEANQLNAQDFFYIYGARRSGGSKRDTYLLPILPQGTASADLFFPLEPGANPGLLVLGNPRPPFRQVAVALGAILKGEAADEPAGALMTEVRPSQIAEPQRIELGAPPPPARQEAGPRPAPPRPTPAPVRQAPEPTPAWSEPIAAPPGETLQLSEAPPRPQAASPPGAAGKASKAAAAAPKQTGRAAKPAATPPRPATTPRPVAVTPPARPAPKWTTPAGAPPQTGWIPVDEEPGDAAPAARPQPKWTTPAGAPPQTGWIAVDDEPAPPGPPPVVPPRPKPAPPAAPKAAKPVVPPAAAQKPKVVFLPNVPGDRILQIFTPPHISLGQNLVLRQGRAGSRGYGWSRIYAEHPNVQLPEIARAATYPHQVWSDGRTFLYLRWSEDQNGALVIQVAGDLIVNAQWATYEELLYWLGPGHVYPRLVYQGAR